ncbi:hypothetical protein GcC1_017004 [Golovinomyces cichoracearum]|uniref:Uncharacterized protein n=1 Tax=Golovinomyces cichoracearum TaxID=62708 RepID=A0A420J5S8_9PEZI|nr:hypothetical protein GcC1_017004 [Golovinomyces cichoracearum]
MVVCLLASETPTLGSPRRKPPRGLMAGFELSWGVASCDRVPPKPPYSLHQ